nr:piggyBac transposable element-derived protein 4-like [Procambarus clarkii]
MSWRGRLSFKVYNPNKPDKYGIKLYMLAEASSGYIYDFEVYAGVGKTTVETVMGLMQPLMYKGYHLYMDNYYNSVHLTEKLREHGVYTCGTIRLHRGAPKHLQQQAKGKIPVDKTIFCRKDNTFLILWKDKRVVSVITNCHNADTQEVERRERVRKRDGTTEVNLVTVNKPNAICDYNTHMKGVDHFDQMVKYYKFTRKCHKWTKKITFYFLQMALHNSYVLYKNYTTDEKKLTLLQFHEVAIWSLLRWDQEWPNTDDPIPHAPDINADSDDGDVDSPGPSGVRRPLFASARRQAHDSSSDSEPETDPSTSHRPPAKKNPRIVDPEDRLNKKLTHAIVKLSKRRRCRVCMKSGVRRDSMYQCKTCGIALCVTPCYTKYHRKRVFWVAKK